MSNRTDRRRSFGGCTIIATLALALAWPLAAADNAGNDSDKDDRRVPGAALDVIAGRGTATTTSGIRAISILGTAWYADNTPIPFARVRLRNVSSGRIESHAAANERGQFAFQDVESGSYMIELVTEQGRVLTVGHTFSVAPGETVATFVRLGTRVPWLTGFFTNAAAAVASGAAAAGVTASAPEALRPVSATQ